MRPPVGVWLVATAALSRPVVDDENPHVCGFTVWLANGRPLRLYRRHCAACAVDQAERGEA